jgi:hypothetical protein
MTMASGNAIDTGPFSHLIGLARQGVKGSGECPQCSESTCLRQAIGPAQRESQREDPGRANNGSADPRDSAGKCSGNILERNARQHGIRGHGAIPKHVLISPSRSPIHA